MIVYRLTVPIDDFEDFVPITDWIRSGSPQDVAWILTAVLALQDAGLGWNGEMRHLPSVGVPTDRTATEPCLDSAAEFGGHPAAGLSQVVALPGAPQTTATRPAVCWW